MKNGVEILTAVGIVGAAMILFAATSPPQTNSQPAHRPAATLAKFAPWPQPDLERRVERLGDRQQTLVERLECRDGVCRRVMVPEEPTPAGQPPRDVAGDGAEIRSGSQGEERSVMVRQGMFGRVHSDRGREGGVFPLFRGGCSGERAARRGRCGG